MTPCWECGAVGPTEDHHVVPVVYGGTRTVPLCPACHGKVHGTNRLAHATLIRAGVASRRARGLHHGAVPYGWTVDDTGLLVEDEDEQGVLRLATDLQTRTKATWRTVAAMLNDGGFTTRSGSPWQGENLRRRVLSDQRTRGRVTG